MYFAGALLKSHVVAGLSLGLSVPTTRATEKKNRNGVELATCLGSNAGSGQVSEE